MIVAMAGSLVAWAWLAFLLVPVLVTRRGWAVRRPRAALHTWAALFATGALGAAGGVALTVRATLEATSDAVTGDPLSACGSCHAAAVFGAGWLLTLAVGSGLVLTACRAADLLVHRRRVGRLTRAACGDLPRHTVDGVAVALLTSPRYLASCAPGRRAQVVVSTALHDLLTPAELAAVVAHEQAHLGRWHRLVSVAAVLHTCCLHGSRTAAEIHGGIGLLVELAADDRAARRCGARTTAAALHKMADASGDDTMRLRARRTALALA